MLASAKQHHEHIPDQCISNRCRSISAGVTVVAGSLPLFSGPAAGSDSGGDADAGSDTTMLSSTARVWNRLRSGRRQRREATTAGRDSKRTLGASCVTVVKEILPVGDIAVARYELCAAK